MKISLSTKKERIKKGLKVLETFNTVDKGMAMKPDNLSSVPGT